MISAHAYCSLFPITNQGSGSLPDMEWALLFSPSIWATLVGRLALIDLHKRGNRSIGYVTLVKRPPQDPMRVLDAGTARPHASSTARRPRASSTAARRPRRASSTARASPKQIVVQYLRVRGTVSRDSIRLDCTLYLDGLTPQRPARHTHNPRHRRYSNARTNIVYWLAVC